MADVVEVIKGLEEIQKHLDTGYSFAISWKSELIRDALELLKTYSAILNEEPFQCKDCEYYGNKYKCPCYEAKFPILNFSCADGVRKNRWLSD